MTISVQFQRSCAHTNRDFPFLGKRVVTRLFFILGVALACGGGIYGQSFELHFISGFSSKIILEIILKQFFARARNKRPQICKYSCPICYENQGVSTVTQERRKFKTLLQLDSVLPFFACGGGLLARFTMCESRLQKSNRAQQNHSDHC